MQVTKDKRGLAIRLSEMPNETELAALNELAPSDSVYEVCQQRGYARLLHTTNISDAGRRLTMECPIGQTFYN